MDRLGRRLLAADAAWERNLRVMRTSVDMSGGDSYVRADGAEVEGAA